VAGVVSRVGWRQQSGSGRFPPCGAHHATGDRVPGTVVGIAFVVRRTPRDTRHAWATSVHRTHRPDRYVPQETKDTITMPKQKTHSGAKDRFRVTRKGKVLHGRQNRAHLLEKKSAARRRRLAGKAELANGDAAQIRKLLNR
jgi:large subunit ribosomal protein L35